MHITTDLDLDSVAFQMAKTLSHKDIRAFVNLVCDYDATLELDEALCADRLRVIEGEYQGEPKPSYKTLCKRHPQL